MIKNYTNQEALDRAWYQTWFNTQYYDILYQNRNEQEARGFIDRLLAHLNPKPGATMLDLACGKGRHSLYLSQQGYDVTGIDLAENSIVHARQFESEHLAFYTHDMRLPFRINYYDYIFNFFTSFGYFERERDDVRTLTGVYKGLKKGGIFILDFFNSSFVRNTLISDQYITEKGIEFHIHKQIEGGRVLKTIAFEAAGNRWNFEESVRLLERSDFERLFSQAGLHIEALYGDYQLAPFDEQTSPRIILKAKKL